MFTIGLEKLVFNILRINYLTPTKSSEVECYFLCYTKNLSIKEVK